MIISAAWQRNNTIRVSLVLAPGELHPKAVDPLTVEQYLRAWLERPTVPAPKVAK